MEEGDGGGSGGAAGGAAGGDGGGAGGRSAGEGGVYDDGLDDLWPARVSSEDFLGQMWEDDPATTSTWTSRHAGGGDALDTEVWDVRIQFEDGQDMLENQICRDDLTYMNLVSMLEPRGYGFGDSMYCRMQSEMELVENNAKIYELLLHFDSTKVLNLTAKRGLHGVAKKLKKPNKAAHQGIIALALLLIHLQLCWISGSDNHPQFYDVDEDGELSDSDEDADVGTHDAAFHMGDFADSVEIRMKEKAEVDEILEEMRKQKEDPMSHCQGDTDIEDLFITADEAGAEPCTEVPLKKMKLPVKRKGPTERSHSSVVVEHVRDFIPSDDEDKCPGFLPEDDDDGFQPLSMILPKGRKSRAKRRPPRVWYDERRLQAHEQLADHMCFTNVEQFRDALVNLLIAQSRNFNYHRNSDVRVIADCINKPACRFYITASEIKGEKTFVIRKMNLEHTCATTTDSSRVSAKWLARRYESLFRSDPNTGIQTLIDKAKLHYGVDVPKMMAYRAKNHALDAVLGDHREQYFRLRDWAQAVIDTNPGSRVIVQTVIPPPSMENPHPGPTFHGLFFCLNGTKEGFLKGCRPFIGLDGCFIKLCTGAQILAATGRDGNNNMFPIAFAVVPKEDTANWCWFLTQLKYALGGEQGEFGPYTIMSDRQKGLLKAVTQVFPSAHQRYCLRHIYANFQTAGFRGEDLKKCMDRASYAYHKDQFEAAMETLKVESEEAWKWLSQIPPHTWARHAFDTNCKTDLVVNNLSEVFNRYILDVRKKPIRTMLIGVKNKLMVRNHEKRVGGETARWVITPHFMEQLELAKKYSRPCTPRISGTDLWEVTNGKGDQIHAVDLAARTCGCRRWDVTGLPCNHACSAIIKAKQKPEDYVSKFFKKPMYIEAFKPMIFPVPGQHDWPKTDTPDIVPPDFKITRGRKAEKRRKGKFEKPKAKDTSRMGTITCSNCKLQGHKYTSCTTPLRPDLLVRKNKHVPNRGEDDPTGPSAADAPRASAADAPRASAATAPRPSAAAAPGPSVADAPGASAAAAPRASAAAAGRGSAAAHRRHAGSSSSTACSTAPPARAAFAPPRSTTPSTESEHEAGYPAYKRTRTWGYMNCGYVDPDHDAGPSN
ncbi:hypothetical protein ACQ4PT_026581 [Festuca glaucescens]